MFLFLCICKDYIIYLHYFQSCAISLASKSRFALSSQFLYTYNIKYVCRSSTIALYLLFAMTTTLKIKTVIIFLVWVIAVCLVVCVGCEWTYGAKYETFVTDAKEKYTPILTYFTISVDNPTGNLSKKNTTQMSSEYLEKRKQANAWRAEQKKNKSNEKDTEEPKTHAYWFWNGRYYSKTDIADTLDIVTVWNNNCPSGCKLWIQIGMNTLPLRVARTDISVLRKALLKGLQEKVEGVHGCYTPADKTPDNKLTCYPCDQQQQPDPPGYGSNSNRTTDVRQTENMWYYLPEYIAKTSVPDLVQRIYSTRGKCPTSCKLLFHGGLNKPLEVNSNNEENIKSVIQRVKDKGSTKGFILCCALRSVTIDRMYNPKTNAFNCQRCSKYIMSDSGADGEDDEVNEDNTNGYDPSEYSPYEIAEFEPSLIKPNGRRWTSADKEVWPYAATMDSEMLCAASSPPPTAKQLYGKDGVVAEGNKHSARNGAEPNDAPSPHTTILHKHFHTFTNTANGRKE